MRRRWYCVRVPSHWCAIIGIFGVVLAVHSTLLSTVEGMDTDTQAYANPTDKVDTTEDEGQPSEKKEQAYAKQSSSSPNKAQASSEQKRIVKGLTSGEVVLIDMVKRKEQIEPREVNLGVDIDSFERENHFVLGISNHPMPLEVETTDSEFIQIATSDGKQLKCSLPIVKEVDAATNCSSSKQIAEERVEERSVQDMLLEYIGEKTMKDCHYKKDGWWTYEFCPTRHIKQYHSENNKIVVEFKLGNFDAEESLAALKKSIADDKKLENQHIALVYNNGTKCDLNGNPRNVHVNIHCTPGVKDTIESVKETSTCSYIVNFGSAHLCKHPDFEQKKLNVEHVVCHPL